MMGARGVARAALRPACRFHPGVGNSSHPGVASPPRRSLRHQAPGRDKPQSLSQLREATLWKALRALRSYRLKFTRAQCVSKVNLNARKRLCALPLAPPVCFWPPGAREAARVLVTQFERESSNQGGKSPGRAPCNSIEFHRDAIPGQADGPTQEETPRSLADWSNHEPSMSLASYRRARRLLDTHASQRA